MNRILKKIEKSLSKIPKKRLDFLACSLIICICLFAGFSITGCSNRNAEPPMIVNVSPIPRTAIISKVDTLDDSYQPINSQWIEWYYANEFRPELSKTLINWDQRFDCNRFAAYFAAKAQIDYLKNTWNSWKAGQAAAIGVFCYCIKGNPKNAHALVIVYTEKGLQFFEPQTGKWVNLTQVEINSRFSSHF